MRIVTILIITVLMLTACSKPSSIQKNQPTQETQINTQKQEQVNTQKNDNMKTEPAKEEKESGPTFLSDQEYDKVDGTFKQGGISYNKNYYGGRLQVDGHPYSKGISGWLMKNDSGSVQYILNGKYKELSGKIGIDDGSQSQKRNSGQIIIYGDEKEVYRSEQVNANSTPSEFNLDISGVKTLKISFSASKDNGSLDPAILLDIIDPKLLK